MSNPTTTKPTGTTTATTSATATTTATSAPTTKPAAVADVDEPTPTDTPTSSNDNTDEAEPKGNAEAAKYRTRLREAEAERDALSSRLEATQRGFIDHLAETQARISPKALWAVGTELADLLDDDGNVSVRAVVKACDAAASELQLSILLPDPSAGRGGGDSRIDTSEFARAFQRRD